MDFCFVSTTLGPKELILSEFVTSTNLRNSDLSNMHSDWHSPLEMTQLCLVSTTLGPKELI